MRTSIAERIFDHIRVTEDGCWEWLGATTRNGYGRFKVGRKHVMVHRASYAEFKGELVEGMQLDHLCRNRVCCNPDHLEQVTPYENFIRGESMNAAKARAAHCQRGHLLSVDNIVPSSARIGARQCWACLRLRNAVRGTGMTVDELLAQQDAASSQGVAS